MRRVDLLKVWSLLKEGKFSKLNSEGKVKYVKTLAALSPVMKDYESYRETVVEKLMSEHEGFQEKLAEAQAYEQYMRGNTSEKPKMTDKEYRKFIPIFQEYNDAVVKAMTEEGEKEVDVKYDKFTSEEFGNFCDSNDFTGEEALALMEIMCDAN